MADAPVAIWRLPPLWYLADLAARSGHHAEAAAAFEWLEAAYLQLVTSPLERGVARARAGVVPPGQRRAERPH